MAPLQRQTESRVKDLKNLRNETFDDSIMMRNVQDDVDLAQLEMDLQRNDEEEFELANRVPDEIVEQYEIQEILESADNEPPDEYDDDFPELQYEEGWM
ncbi:hypothetical protein GPJ56_005158 [Histomonas meleagridis]|uniref:uncharacterized protein n=1 Tax=Histomonas meleagridis TaxID=135588 RepID=UPI0035594C53|nr:hypothetical protein GPJ56_005158 [Histomonas meleagridis]KAH0802674.1 hypothetical protein GO595_004723 [Histomonas meleagridis]